MVHGEWEQYCRVDANMSPVSARLYIRIFDRFNGNQQRVVGLPVRVLDVLTTFTDEELEETHALPTGEEKKLTEMTRREIEELKRGKKQAEARADAERKERERLESLADKPPEIRYSRPGTLERVSKGRRLTEWAEL